MNKFLTISIPTYNRCKHLKETMQVVLPQLNEEIECFVSDNGSEDETWEYVNQLSTVRALRFPQNLGFDRNIVRCVEEAKGEYIAFLGDDDIPSADGFRRIAQVLKEIKPKLLYINHFPFFNGDINQRLEPYLPSEDRLLESGWNFIRLYGLGHISSLVVQREAALKYLSSVKDERMCAHFDIAGRIALNEEGPFYYMGTQWIAGRTPDQARYVPLEACVINQALFWRDLFRENLIDRKKLNNRYRALIRHDLIKMAFKGRLDGSFRKYREPLDELFGSLWLYRLCVCPFNYLPIWGLRPIERLVRRLLSIARLRQMRSLRSQRVFCFLPSSS